MAKMSRRESPKLVEIVRMIDEYNSGCELSYSLDIALAKYLLNHRLFRKAITGIKDKKSAIVEIGSFNGYLLEQ